uniref:Retrotransposon Copia-like N-terminal domain-containing protein n=1 Tax=Cannabis sativa TaxID=3483 RepID=A0A803P5H6_CANSA
MARGGGVRTRVARDHESNPNDPNSFSILGENSRSTNVNDLSNPYFLSNGDNPGAVLVPKILTGSENYSTWRRSMMIALVARKKIRFINGKLPQREKDDEDYDSWCRCNSTVISWILHAISGEIADSILYHDNAAEIWDELHERFNEKNAPRIFEAKKMMQSLTQGSNTVTTYFTRLKSLWDQIREYRPQLFCSYDAMKIIQEYQEEDRLLEFLVGLNDSYSMVRSQIPMRDPLLNVSKAYASVVEEERQRNLTNGSSNNCGNSCNEGDQSISNDTTQFAGNVQPFRPKYSCTNC